MLRLIGLALRARLRLRRSHPALERRPLRKSVEQTPCARGSAARAVPLTEPVQVKGGTGGD